MVEKAGRGVGCAESVEARIRRLSWRLREELSGEDQVGVFGGRAWTGPGASSLQRRGQALALGWRPRATGRDQGPEEVARGWPGRVLKTSLPAPAPSRGGKGAGDWCSSEEGERVRRGGRRAGGPWGCRGRPAPPGPPAGVLAPGAAAHRGRSVLQVYPEPRSESECLSNIREFLRGCGASLRLEVSRRGGRAGAAAPRLEGRPGV